MTRWLLAVAMVVPAGGAMADMTPPARERFRTDATSETPDFQKHVLPLMGKAGCNGRACHGSFQGAGGFRLSLFGYDFKSDHEALTKGAEPRVDRQDAEESKILRKPTLAMPHKGGKRIKHDTWEYRLIQKWVAGGAKEPSHKAQFQKLEVTPTEIVFKKPGETVPLKVIAHWSDGAKEDVTCISRFRSNDESIASIDAEGVVKSLTKGDTHVVAFYDNGVHAIPALLPVSDYIGANYPATATPTRIDELVIAKLKKLGMVQSETCTDTEFLRRATLDITGTLPTPAEVEAFMKSKDPQKRSKLVDELLERPSYASWWTTRLCDVTGHNQAQLQEQVQQINAHLYRQWYDWIHQRVKDNKPYDQIIAGIVLATSRKPGQSYEEYTKEMADYFTGKKNYADRDTMAHYWLRRNMQKPEEKALAFSHAFLGVRLQCAECHKHPFDQWTQQDFEQFKAFFTQVDGRNVAPDARQAANQMREKFGMNKKGGNQNEVRQAMARAVAAGEPVPLREVYVGNTPVRQGPKGQGNKGKRAPVGRVITPKVLGGEEVITSQYKDAREPLMEWMRAQDNPYFARAFVNRVWANYFNVGIVEPPDDMNLANPPSNEPLLDYLTDGFIKNNFDMKWLHREITNSRTYQLSWKPDDTNALDTRNFARAVIRRLPAEVAHDALLLATADATSAGEFDGNIAERATGLPPLEGKGKRPQNPYALRIFGKPQRVTSCDCERSNEPTLVQSLFLRNDQFVEALLTRRDGWLASLAIGLNQAGAIQPVPMPQPTKGKGIKPGKPERAKGNDRGAGDGNLAEQIAQMEKRLARAKQSGKVDGQKLVAAERELGQMRQRLRQQQGGPGTAIVRNLDAAKLIREAYLRTVSRPPTAQEIEIAKKYISESRNAITGLRDVLWALINTKEFITNH